MPTISSRVISLFGFFVAWISLLMRVLHEAYPNVPNPHFILTTIGIALVYAGRALWKPKPANSISPNDFRVRRLIWAKRGNMVLILVGIAGAGYAVLSASSFEQRLFIFTLSFCVQVVAIALGLYVASTYRKLLNENK